ncbi:MAG: sigma 54-interacting transcriptional regulator [Candidatus Latescibacteria bacterium]|nr:sigma 54-interacting transcriptional regulator [Candidatus Latescibacterota bacterium]
MSADRRKVLTMVSEGKISVEDAEAMLDALEPKQTASGSKVKLVGDSDAAKQLQDRVQEVARIESPVLIVGEEGTGKELIARAVHGASRRMGHPFIGFSCAASVENNDAEIFGVEQGGPGGDVKRGLLETAQGGTLFLDIGSVLLPETQHRLYSYLMNGYFTRLNGVQPVYCDVRIMVANSVDLVKEVKSGQFRADLYDRLAVCKVMSPPLRERAEDIPILTRFFVEKRAERDGRSVPVISDAVMETLNQYAWPQNVRELAGVIEQTVALCDGDELLPEHLPVLAS